MMPSTARSHPEKQQSYYYDYIHILKYVSFLLCKRELSPVRNHVNTLVGKKKKTARHHVLGGFLSKVSVLEKNKETQRAQTQLQSITPVPPQPSHFCPTASQMFSLLLPKAISSVPSPAHVPRHKAQHPSWHAGTHGRGAAAVIHRGN